MADTSTHKSPYVGPRAFQLGEQLFGRDYEIHELLNQLISERIVLLHAPSGAGKSSLVQAGLVPCLKEEGFLALPVIRVSQQLPETTVTRRFNRYVFSTLLSLEERLPVDQRHPEHALTEMSLPEYLAEAAAYHPASAQERDPAGAQDAQPDSPASLVLIFDQFEEILTIDPNDQAGKLTFFNQLGDALRNRSYWALFSMREEFMPALTPYLRPVPTHLANRYRLNFLDVNASVDAIRKPAEQAGVDFTEPAAQLLVNDLRRVQMQQPDGSFRTELGGAVEPLQLQVVCLRLWKNRQEGDTQIDEQDVGSLGNVNVSLSEYYNQTVAEIAGQLNLNERAIRSWFQEQLITPSGIRGQVMLEPDKTRGLENEAITRLINAHLVRTENRGGVTWFELAHDRLISPVRESNQAWFDANLSLLQKQAALWDSQGRPDGMLLRGQGLDDARAWARQHYEDLTVVERSFLKICADAIDHEQEAQQLREQSLLLDAERQRAEMAQRRAEEQKRAAIQARVMLVGLSLLFLVVLGLTFFAGNTVQQKEQISYTAVAAKTDENSAQSTAEVLNTEVAAAVELANIKRAQLTQLAEESNSALATQSAFLLQQPIAAPTKAQPVATPAPSVPGGPDRSIQLANTALNKAKQQNLSLLLAVEANRVWHTFEGRSALLNLLTGALAEKKESLSIRLTRSRSPVNALAFSPEGKILAAAVAGQLTQWDTVGTLQFGKPQVMEAPQQISSGSVDGIFYNSYGSLMALVNPRAEPAAARQAGPQTVDGVLVSARSEKIDWEAARPAVAFAYVRATASDDIVDASFADNWYGLKKVGIPRGAFHVLYFDTSPEAQAKHFLEAAAFEPGDLPPLLDVEATGMPPDMTMDSKAQWVQTWLGVVQKATGMTPLLYFAPNVDPDGTLASDLRLRVYSVWVEAFSEPDPKQTFHDQKWFFWHYTDHGKVAGVRSLANLIRFNGSLQDLLALGLQPFAVTVQDIATGRLVVTSRSAIFNPLASRSGLYIGYTIDNQVTLADSQTFTAQLQIPQDGRVLAINEPGRYLVFDDGSQPVLLTFDKQLIKLNLPRPTVAAVSPDGKILALAGEDGSLVLALPGKTPQEPFIEQLQPLFKLTSALAFSADGATLMAGSSDGSIGLLNIETRNWLSRPIRAHAGPVTILQPSAQVDLFASGGQDGQVLLWDLRNETLDRRACAVAGGDLTEQQWNTFLGDLPYQKTCSSRK